MILLCCYYEFGMLFTVFSYHFCHLFIVILPCFYTTFTWHFGDTLTGISLFCSCSQLGDESIYFKTMHYFRLSVAFKYRPVFVLTIDRYNSRCSCSHLESNHNFKTIHEKWKWKWCIMIAGRSIARIKVVPAIAVRPLRASQYSKV